MGPRREGKVADATCRRSRGVRAHSGMVRGRVGVRVSVGRGCSTYYLLLTAHLSQVAGREGAQQGDVTVLVTGQTLGLVVDERLVRVRVRVGGRW